MASPVTGSSPQARGTPPGLMCCSRSMGIIPAGAGNSWYEGPRGLNTGDHPRRRGELYVALAVLVALAGSSPQARGTQSNRRNPRTARGIIPAGAGNSGLAGDYGPLYRDHPRRRGELLSVAQLSASRTGSSPQARGTPPNPSAKANLDGIIPAGAGNSLLS